MGHDKRIVFDLEWNQDFHSHSYDYYGQPRSFRGEIIQIGALRLSDGEEFSMTLKPRYFPKIHERIAELTGLTQEQLDSSPPTALGLREFLNWCGEDAVLLEWSCEDVLVLKQNLFLYGLGERFPKRCYDLQAAFARQFKTEKQEPSLADAVKQLGIEENWSYHEAISDARYAAEVCRSLDWTKEQRYIERSQDKLKRYASRWLWQEDIQYHHAYLSAESWRLAPELKRVDCLFCGEELQPSDHWQKSPDNKSWYSLQTCSNCAGSNSPAARGIIVRVKEQEENHLHNFAIGRSYPNNYMEQEWKRRYAIEKKRRKKRPPQPKPVIKGRLLHPRKQRKEG